MSRAPTAAAGASPFTARTALALVLFGSCMFVALLWLIGNGLGEGRANDGGGHAEGRGLNGFAAMSDFLERRGFTVRHGRSEKSFKEPGLLVLTPPANMDGKTIEKIVSARRQIGPTLVITPKWNAYATGSAETNAKRGWVHLAGPTSVEWRGFLDNLTLYPVDSARKPDGREWFARGIRGTFPQPALVMAGKGPGMVPLVLGADGRDVFAAYVDDGVYPALTEMSPADWPIMAEEDEGEAYPLVMVYDPDLLDNYGMARQSGAQLAEALVRGAMADADGETSGPQTVTFDLTLNGIKRSDNLLTMAFSPPFLAATLCLLLAAAAVGWRAFLRFGPARVPARAIAFGKRALVANSAGLIVRSRRYHLLGPPLADASRQRLVRAFALPRDRDTASELAALDQAARAAGAGDHAFSQISARLSQARNQRDLVKAAAELHALERTLTR
jgi:hypothetical protein